MEIKLVGHNVYDFNPRTREGCDLQSGHIRHISGHFNPRTREGCDKTFSCFLLSCFRISIHAPVKGATSTGSLSSAFHDISIHAPVKGATYFSRLHTSH